MKAIPSSPEAMRLFMEGTRALSQIESAGIRIDTAYLERACTELDARKRKLSEALRADPLYAVWRRAYGGNLTVGSSEQLGRVLFDFEKIPYPKGVDATETGKRKMSEEVLAHVDHPFVKTWQSYKRAVKMRSTYLEQIRRETCDGFLHPIFNLAGGGAGDSERGGARSYRSSASMINLQNQPIRDPEYGEIVRKCFVPREGHRLGEADFGAIEFRMAAVHWDDPRMKDYAADPKKDIHRDEASRIYACPRRQVSKGMRYLGKNGFVFPVLYGSYYRKCAENIWGQTRDKAVKLEDGTPALEWLGGKGVGKLGACRPGQDALPNTFEAHMKKVEGRFMDRFSTFASGKEDWWREYQKHGAFRMLSGFVCRGVYSRNAVMNYPIQGIGFHCLLWSLVRLQRWLRKNRMRSLIIGQIHDSILMDLHRREVRDVLAAAKRIMTEELPAAWRWISVPLVVECEVAPEGASWFAKEKEDV